MLGYGDGDIETDDARGWVRPDYGARGFAAIPGTIEALLTGATARARVAASDLAVAEGHVVDRLVFVYFDAFGWAFLQHHADHPFLRRVEQEGRIVRLTAQFPSTTSAHVTTIHTGRPLPDHGVLEWHCYEPRLDRIISPLRFAFHDGSGDLEAAGLRPGDVFGEATLYADLARAGVSSTVHQSAAYAGSVPTRGLARAATLLGFRSSATGLAAAAACIAREPRAYAMVYLDEFDTALHLHGPTAPEAHRVATRILDELARFADGLPPGTCLLLSADHGQVPVSPQRTTYLNVVWPDLHRHLRHGGDGRPLVPAGSCRDLFLHVRPERVDDVHGRLCELLAGRATVERVVDLVADGWFGRPSERLSARLSELVIVPAVGEAVWWWAPPAFEQTFLGQHGGPSREEMEIPLASLVV